MIKRNLSKIELQLAGFQPMNDAVGEKRLIKIDGRRVQVYEIQKDNNYKQIYDGRKEYIDEFFRRLDDHDGAWAKFQ